MAQTQSLQAEMGKLQSKHDSKLKALETQNHDLLADKIKLKNKNQRYQDLSEQLLAQLEESDATCEQKAADYEGPSSRKETSSSPTSS